ncbi:MAG: alpha/beta hydrolase [Candidatus Andersenbacteria bacterium]
MAIKVLILLLFFAALPAYAQAISPATDDLFDTTNGSTILTNSLIHSVSSADNILGGSGGTAEKENLLFKDGGSKGDIHFVEWKTASPITLEKVHLFASHDPASKGRDANFRGFSKFTLFAQESNGELTAVAEFSPENPYGSGAENNELAQTIELVSPATSQRFRAEFVQFGNGSPTASGPRIIELDGFGEALGISVEPESSTADLWDVAQGAEVTSHSGVTTQHGGADIRDMFGGTFWGYEPDSGKTNFADSKPKGTIHFVEWHTQHPITLQRFTLFADHDFKEPSGSALRDANHRGFSKFTLFAKVDDVFEPIYEYFPANPYGGGTNNNELIISADIDDVEAQEFRAEFEQFGPTNLLHSGPRITELDGFGVVHDELEPVVIIPGIFASFNTKVTLLDKSGGTWRFILTADKVYRGLIERLEAAGYEEEKTLFIAHYDWRQANSESAGEYIKPVIDQAKLKSGSNKVDIVAHSMGGLTARSYIQSEDYDSDVDQLIMLGTPNEGAADAYIAWEGGEFPSRWQTGTRWYIAMVESALRVARTNTEPRPLSIRTFFPSIKDLLPITSFASRDGNNVVTTDQNTFLKDLKSAVGELESKGVNVTTIAGNDLATLGSVTLDSEDSRSSEDIDHERWRDGPPSPNPPQTDTTAGDKTVLLASALLGSDTVTIANAEHDKLPEEAQEAVLEALGAGAVGTHIAYNLPDSAISIAVLSPVDPTITGPGGELSSTINTFPEAEFVSDEDADGPKLLIIANPSDGEYQVTLTGTGAGEYHIITTYADDDETTSTVKEGATTPGQQDTIMFSINGGSFTPPVDSPPLSPSPNNDGSNNSGNEQDCCPGPDPTSPQSTKKGRILGTTIKAVKKADPWARLRPLNSIFASAFGRMPSSEEWHYWANRLLTDKPQYNALYGAMQWQLLHSE